MQKVWYAVVGIALLSASFRDGVKEGPGKTDGLRGMSGGLKAMGGGSKKIGTQVWAAVNLEVSVFRNGEAIPEARTEQEWVKAGEEGRPAWCYYGNDPANGRKYGKLYNWFAVNDPRGLAPVGWHIPTDQEWEVLVAYLGGEAAAAKSMMAAKDGGKDGGGAGVFGGLPGGRRLFYGLFDGEGSHAYWWTTSEGKLCISQERGLSSNRGFVNGFDYEGRTGLAVRCIKDRQ